MDGGRTTTADLLADEIERRAHGDVADGSPQNLTEAMARWVAILRESVATTPGDDHCRELAQSSVRDVNWTDFLRHLDHVAERNTAAEGVVPRRQLGMVQAAWAADIRRALAAPTVHSVEAWLLCIEEYVDGDDGPQFAMHDNDDGTCATFTARQLAERIVGDALVRTPPPAPEGDTETALARARAEHEADHHGLSTPWCPWCYPYPPADPTRPPEAKAEAGGAEDVAVTTARLALDGYYSHGIRNDAVDVGYDAAALVAAIRAQPVPALPQAEGAGETRDQSARGRAVDLIDDVEHDCPVWVGERAVSALEAAGLRIAIRTTDGGA